MSIPLNQYSATEEKLNTWTHGVAVVLSVIATVVLLITSVGISWQATVGVLMYGISMILLFSASTCYHASRDPAKRIWLKRLDHCAIYYLIAGTYTPFLALFIPTAKAKIFLLILWGIAFIGTVFKLLFIHKWQKVSLLAYIAMGWLAIFMLEDMKTHLSAQAITLLVAGGLFYTVGAVFYALKRIHYTHAIWHVFVILGAGSHFFAIHSMFEQLLP